MPRRLVRPNLRAGQPRPALRVPAPRAPARRARRVDGLTAIVTAVVRMQARWADRYVDRYLA